MQLLFNTPKKNKIVWVGRLTNQKNPEMMIEVFDLVAMSKGDSWVREMQKLCGGKETNVTMSIQLEKIEGE